MVLLMQINCKCSKEYLKIYPIVETKQMDECIGPLPEPFYWFLFLVPYSENDYCVIFNCKKNEIGEFS